MFPAKTLRSPLEVTLAVWKALFLRDVVNRMSRQQGAWLWMLLEPAAHLIIVMFMFTIIKQRVVIGGDPAIFIMLGIMGFILPRSIMNRCRNAVSSNAALYAYRQVKPVDSVLVQAAIEGFLQIIVLIILLNGAAFFGLPAVPVNPLGAVAALCALAFAGLGLALIISVAHVLLPGLSQLMRLLIIPMYFMSAILYPSSLPPPRLQGILLYNPFVHGIESLRAAFMPQYRIPDEINLGYLFGFGIVLVFLGLALHVRYQTRLATS